MLLTDARKPKDGRLEAIYGKEYLLQENLFSAEPIQIHQSMIVVFIKNDGSKNTRFYLDFAAKIHIYYNKLLFSIYQEKNLSFVHNIDYT